MDKEWTTRRGRLLTLSVLIRRPGYLPALVHLVDVRCVFIFVSIMVQFQMKPCLPVRQTGIWLIVFILQDYESPVILSIIYPVPKAIRIPVTTEIQHHGRDCKFPNANRVATAAKTAGITLNQVFCKKVK